MNRLNITAKIWLSIGVFVLGFVLSTVLGQLQGLQTERKLRVAAEGLFPAAERSQEAEAAFQRMVKGFGDAVVMQDASGLDRAADDGRQSVAALKAMAAIQGLDPERSRQAKKLAASVDQLLTDARATYGAVLASAASLSSNVQDQMRALASRTDEAKASLAKIKQQAAADLQHQLNSVEQSSANQRLLSMAVFAVTLVLAAIIVNLTIRRSITGPVVRVISGVKDAAEETARAAADMAQSGDSVAQNAQSQAAFIEETSASLEEISSTAKQNASRAEQADGLMQAARQTMERAVQAMNDLTASMQVISKSSNQVAGVLKSIDEIAFQTNLLALNAAVEAARAGQAGAGFSVVADEVRSLAQRAAEASRNSTSIIEQTIGNVTKGVELVGLAHGAFLDVSTKISSGTQVVSQIATTSEEQARGVTNIGQAILRIREVTQQNAANAERTAEAAAAMTSQARNTREFLDQLEAVVGMHDAKE